MRRFALSLATIALVAATAAPAAAAPVSNPQVTTYFLTCGDVTTTVAAKGVPGWSTELGPANTPVLLLGGHVTVWDGGAVVFDGDNATPPGLDGKVTTCRVEGPTWSSQGGPWYLVYDPAYILFPG
jgi:hypothetical protein